MSNPYRYGLNRLILWLRSSASLLWLVVFAVYLITVASRAVLRSYQSQQQLNGLQQQLSGVQLEKARLQSLVVYYRSDSFKEKQLRQELLLHMPGETVYALPESSGPQADEDAVATGQRAVSTGAPVPLWRQWVGYLIHGR